MRASRVLIVGLSALGAEVAKNLILAGVNVIFADDTAVAPAHLGAQFFLSAADVGRSVRLVARARALHAGN